MSKNVAILLLTLAALFEGGLLITGRGGSIPRRLGLVTVQASVPSGTNSPTPNTKPQILTKGMKLSDSPISKYAYKIAPGELSSDAKTALIGWNMAVQTLRDGSETITLTPKDSDDQKQQYILTKGNQLYFVEMVSGDDQNGKDQTTRDDYGVIVDGDGVVQSF